jgi:hypothetical protein
MRASCGAMPSLSHAASWYHHCITERMLLPPTPRPVNFERFFMVEMMIDDSLAASQRLVDQCLSTQHVLLWVKDDS